MVIQKLFMLGWTIVHSQKLSLYIYRLICYFEGSKKLWKDNFEAEYINLIDEHQEEEIISTLINISIIVRKLDDKHWFGLNDIIVWNLIIKNKSKNLNLREACNKILHSKEYKFEVHNIRNFRHLKTKIHFFWEKNNIPRKASIDIYKFTKEINQRIIGYT